MLHSITGLVRLGWRALISSMSAVVCGGGSEAPGVSDGSGAVRLAALHAIPELLLGRPRRIQATLARSLLFLPQAKHIRTYTHTYILMRAGTRTSHTYIHTYIHTHTWWSPRSGLRLRGRLRRPGLRKPFLRKSFSRPFSCRPVFSQRPLRGGEEVRVG